MQKTNTELALFKFRLIAPVLNSGGLGKIGQMEYFRKITEVEHKVPGIVKPIKYKPETLKKWLHIYRKYGFDRLAGICRKDIGTFRFIEKETADQIKQLADEYIFRTAKTLYKYVISQDVIKSNQCCYATFNTYTKKHKLLDCSKGNKNRKSFEKRFINMMWVGDLMYGPYVKKGKSNFQSYLISFMDDHSRFIVGSRFFTEQNTIAVETVLKDALGAYGLPSSLYLDNAKVFVTQSLVVAGARLGFFVTHSKPGDPASRGKKERFYRTVRDQFLDLFLAKFKKMSKQKTAKEKPTLEKLNEEFSKWLYEYQHRKHSTTGESPHDRFMKGITQVTLRKASKKKIEQAFNHEISRKVSGHALVSIDKIDYEVPGKFINKDVKLYFNPTQPNLYFICDEDTDEVTAIRPVDRHSNAEFPIKFKNKKD